MKRLIILLLIVGCGEKPQTEIKESSLDSLGIWELNYFVDEFGDAANSGYITTSHLVNGTFSNSATTNSILSVRFIITEYSVAIKLYEYGRNHPVTVSKNYPKEYEIHIKHNGEIIDYNIAGKNESDRIEIGTIINPNMQRILTTYLNLQGSMQFSIKEKSKYGVPSTYKFVINDVSPFGFSNAWKKLTGLEYSSEHPSAPWL